MKFDVIALDMYGKPVTFNLSGKSVIQSKLGCFFTLCTLLIFSAFSYGEIKILLFNRLLSISILEQADFFDFSNKF
jgi:hypothetical protein